MMIRHGYVAGAGSREVGSAKIRSNQVDTQRLEYYRTTTTDQGTLPWRPGDKEEYRF
jgi:hypothetical protein